MEGLLYFLNEKCLGDALKRALFTKDSVRNGCLACKGSFEGFSEGLLLKVEIGNIIFI